jgi:hypothetical protein
MEDVGIFYGHLVYFMDIWSTLHTAIWYTLWTLGIFCGNLVYFSMFLYIVLRKIWQPCDVDEFSPHGKLKK